jgi:hypothetical protein
MVIVKLVAAEKKGEAVGSDKSCPRRDSGPATDIDAHDVEAASSSQLRIHRGAK